MPQSHKHKQLRATEMSLSDCAINDVTEKQNKQQTCPSQTHDQQDWIQYQTVVWGVPARISLSVKFNTVLCQQTHHRPMMCLG